jgi:hypothetical protein
MAAFQPQQDLGGTVAEVHGSCRHHRRSSTGFGLWGCIIHAVDNAVRCHADLGPASCRRGVSVAVTALSSAHDVQPEGERFLSARRLKNCRRERLRALVGAHAHHQVTSRADSSPFTIQRHPQAIRLDSLKDSAYQ